MRARRILAALGLSAALAGGMVAVAPTASAELVWRSTYFSNRPVTGVGAQWNTTSGCGGTCWEAKATSVGVLNGRGLVAYSARYGYSGNANCYSTSVSYSGLPRTNIVNFYDSTPCRLSGTVHPYVAHTITHQIRPEYGGGGGRQTNVVVHYLCGKVVFDGAVIQGGTGC